MTGIVVVLALAPGCASREPSGPAAEAQYSPGSSTTSDPGQMSEGNSDGATPGNGSSSGGSGPDMGDGNGPATGSGTGPATGGPGPGGGKGPATGGGPATGSGGPAGTGNGNESGTSTGNGAGTKPGTGTGTGTGTTDTGFAWVPFGPADPSDPPPEQLFGLLERRDCETLATSSEDPPWPALTAVCRAAVEGDTSQWAVAAAAATAGGGDTGCYADAARALLTRALEWHARNPDGVPEIAYPTAGDATACDFRITDVRLVDEDGQLLEGPLQGPLTGGTLLVIDGEGIDDPESVVIGWGPATIDENISAGGEDGVVVRTPPAPQSAAVDITLRNRAGQVVAPVQFTYVDTGTSSGASATSSGAGG